MNVSAKSEDESPIRNFYFSEAFNIMHMNISDVYWVYDLAENCFNYISPSVLLLRGFTAEEAMLQDFSQSMHTEDYDYILKHLQPRIILYESGDDSMKSMVNEIRQPRKDGSMAWVEISTNLIKNPQGRVHKVCGISRDISHKKSDLELLKETQSLFESVFNNTLTGIALMQENGAFINVNNGLCKMLGFPRNFLLRKNLFHFVAQEDIAVVQNVIKTAKRRKNLEKQCEIRLTNINGQNIWGFLNITGVKFAKDRTVQWVIQFHETTSRKNSEKIIRELNADLQLKNKEMEQLVYLTSHDLRSPLVNIHGFSGELRISVSEIMWLLENHGTPVAKEKIETIGQSINESFGYINSSIQKMDKLLKGLLNYSRLGKKITAPQVIDMDQMMVDVVNTYEFLLKNSRISIEITPLPSCWGSEDLINQAFSNLLGNAIKYLDNSRPGLIKISGHTNDTQAIYCIEDNGIGIDKKHHEKVFELFYRLYPEKGEGEGLGLSTVKKIIEISRGKIELISQPGEGSQFIVYLPLKEKADIG